MKAIALMAALLLATTAQAGPRYASDETRRVIEAMVEAHGGLERWRAAPSIRFYSVMHDNYARKEAFAWWIAYEVIDQKTRKVWQHWPMEDADVGYDSESVWWSNRPRANPPPQFIHFFYYFVNLPWITQDDGVALGEVKRFDWPGMGKELYEVKMTFDEAPGVGKSGKDYFVLYVDPDNYRLAGYQYAVGYRPMMDIMGQPPEREVFGPLWRLITRYEEVGGLLFPSAFRTMPEADERIVGNHVILDIDVSQPFEYEKARMPAGASRYEGPLTTE